MNSLDSLIHFPYMEQGNLELFGPLFHEVFQLGWSKREQQLIILAASKRVRERIDSRPAAELPERR